MLLSAMRKDVYKRQLQAFVMPENLYSSKVLLNNGFVKEDFTAQEKNWGGQEIVTVDVYTYKKDL